MSGGPVLLDETTITIDNNGAPDPLLSVDFGVVTENIIGDFVWLDADRDGVQDGGESGVRGVTVELLDGAGVVVRTVITDTAGAYQFAGLPSGTYTVVFDRTTLPTGQFAGPAGSGTDAAIDSDGDPSTGRLLFATTARTITQAASALSTMAPQD